MIALARAYFIFEATNLSLKISDDFLKNFEITLTSLVIFYFFSISGDNTIADIVWARSPVASNRASLGPICLKAAVCKLHSHKIAIDIILIST